MIGEGARIQVEVILASYKGQSLNHFDRLEKPKMSTTRNAT